MIAQFTADLSHASILARGKLKRLKLMKTLEKMEKNAKLMKVKVDSTKIIRKYRDAR